MGTMYTVQPGESLSVIALRHGFHNWKTIYDHPQNEPFRKLRPNPNLICPGDRIFIPDKAPKVVNADTGKVHAYKVKSAKQAVEFSLTLLDEREPSKGIPAITVKLKLPGGQEYEATTDSTGTIMLAEPTITAGNVDVMDINDASEPALIRYKRYAKSGLATNQSNVIKILDKRSIVNRIVATHKIRRRLSWGKRTPSYTTMDEDWDYTTVVIHHSGDSGEKVPTEIEEMHMGKKGWDDVGYHYLIPPDGTIYEGRYLTYKGSHVDAANTQKIGILIMGDFEHQIWDSDDDPTIAQLTAAENLIKTLKTELGTITKLGGHRDYKKTTECPGGELYSLLGGMRATTGLGGP